MQRKKLAYQFLFWPALFILFIGFFYLFGVVTIPFTVSTIFAYALYPAYKKLLKIFNSETIASFIVTFGFVSFFILFFVFFMPHLQQELIKLIKIVPRCIAQVAEAFSPIISNIFDHLSISDQKDLRHLAINMSAEMTKNLLEFVLKLFAGGGFITTGAATLVIAPFAVFFLLRDSEKLVNSIRAWIPKNQLPLFEDVYTRIDETLYGYFKGQLSVSLIMGGYYLLTLQALGLDTAILMGSLSSILSFAPTIGALIGLVIALFFGIVQFGVEYQIVIIAAIYLSGQFFEANILVPRLIGTKVGLHPLWVFFAIYAGISLYGIVGVTIAVPIAAVINVVIRFALERFHKSDIYLN